MSNAGRLSMSSLEMPGLRYVNSLTPGRFFSGAVEPCACQSGREVRHRLEIVRFNWQFTSNQVRELFHDQKPPGDG